MAWDCSGQTNDPVGLTNVIAIASGCCSDLRLALTADGVVTAWGSANNVFGELNVPADLSNVVAISAGQLHSLALKSDGTVVAWGAGATTNLMPYVDWGQSVVPAGLSNVVAIAGGYYHSMALRSDGTVVWWGADYNGLIHLPADLSNVVMLASGMYHNLALRADGSMAAWGLNYSGEGGVPDGATNLIAVTAGAGHNLALKADGTVLAWGSEQGYCQGFPSGEFTGVVAIADGDVGSPTSVALKADGTVVGRGCCFPTGLTNIQAIAVGNLGGVALVGDGPPPTSAAVTGLIRDHGSFRLTVASQSGRVYRLEYKNALVEADWVGLPLVAGNGGALTLTDSTAVSTQRFYRVRRW